MSMISDRELVQFHYADGLPTARTAQIQQALVFDAELRLRLADLRESLAVIGDAWTSPEADAQLETRLWQRLQPQLEPRRASPGLRARLAAWVEPLRPAPLAFASLLGMAVVLGYSIGRQQTPPPGGVTSAPLLAEDASARVLASYLGAHLHDAERALLVASNSPDDAATAQSLARSLLDSNQMYALAAERAGKPALAQFLRELEPVLIELSNEDGRIAAGLGEQIRERDLAFKSRAAAVMAQRDFASPAQSL